MVICKWCCRWSVAESVLLPSGKKTQNQSRSGTAGQCIGTSSVERLSSLLIVFRSNLQSLSIAPMEIRYIWDYLSKRIREGNSLSFWWPREWIGRYHCSLFVVHCSLLTQMSNFPLNFERADNFNFASDSWMFHQIAEWTGRIKKRIWTELNVPQAVREARIASLSKWIGEETFLRFP
jgi:hypothetical protein